MVCVNGEIMNEAAGKSIREMLRMLDYQNEMVAVECNDVIISRQEWDTVFVPEEAKVEIVRFVGGG